jgi:hypothetical protein
MGKILVTMGLAGLVLCAGPAARADDQDSDWQKQFRFRLQDFDKLMQGMDDLLKSIPRYETPIINDNGDIVIRRVPRDFEFDPLQRPEESEFADI